MPYGGHQQPKLSGAYAWMPSISAAAYEQPRQAQRSVETATAIPTLASSLMRVSTSLCGMLVGKLAMVMSCRRVLFGLFVLANRVMVRRLMVMMRGGMVVTGRRVMMLMRRMSRCLCHFDTSFSVSSDQIKLSESD